MIRVIAGALVAGLLTVSCTSAPTQPTVGGAGTIDQFTLAVDILASVPYTFAVTQTSNAAVTLASVVDSQGQISKTPLSFAVGSESTDGLTCTPLTTVTTAASLKPQINTTLNPGSYCVLVSDPGTLTDSVTVVGRVILNGPIPVTASGSAKTETFASNIPAGGSASRTFYVTEPGIVSVTLQSLSPPSSAVLGVGIPGLDNTGCNLNTSVKATASSTPQITVPVDIASFCVRLYDDGSLITGPNGLASFTIQIVHP